MMTDKNTGEIILYQPDNSIRLEVMLEDETVWLTQAQMSMLFGRDRTVIGRHIRNIFAEGELQENEVCANFAHTTQHGAIRGKTQTSTIQFFNLDVIISVGYRVKSQRGTQFRKWANKVLKEYLLRGYVFNRRMDMIEQFAIETEQRITVTEYEIAKLKHGIEAVLTDQNDINEDTRIQLELVNKTLADLQVKNRELNKPRNPIGYKMD
ncbi:MAG: virulence RhuM family protein [Tannerella sp.]|jgi:hypothetical protein|nr:virulence RhuM family protein [Tannerella sp.]